MAEPHIKLRPHAKNRSSHVLDTPPTPMRDPLPSTPPTARRPNGGASEVSNHRGTAAPRATTPHRALPKSGHKRGASFAEGICLHEPPAQTPPEVQGRAIDHPVCWVRVRWCRPLPARLENPERVGVQSNRSRGDPCDGLPIPGEVLVTTHQIPATLSGFALLTIARRGNTCGNYWREVGQT